MPSYLMTLWKTMTSRLAARPMRRLSGPAILLAIGFGVAATCGVANADPFQQVRYEVSGPGVAEFVSYQTAKGQQRATNINLPWSSELTCPGRRSSPPSAGRFSCSAPKGRAALPAGFWLTAAW